jgi:hypothetical protein
MYTADVATHLKIMAIGLLAAVLISLIGIVARERNPGIDFMIARGPAVIIPGAPDNKQFKLRPEQQVAFIQGGADKLAAVAKSTNIYSN